MTAFNYDCARRHNARDIEAKLKRIQKTVYREDGSVRDWVLSDIKELEALLVNARP